VPRSIFFSALAALALGLAACQGAEAQDPGPTLHEFFTYRPGAVEGTPSELPELPEPGADDSALGPAAAAPMVYTPEGPTLGEALGPPHQQEPPGLPNVANEAIGLDGDTSSPEYLQYVEVFEPSVAPYKRLGARNGVIRRPEMGGIPELGVTGNPALPVAMTPEVPPGHDVFVGRIQLETDGVRSVPVPSVAPHMLVHQLDLAPDAPATWSRDEAGNYALHVAQAGVYDLTWVVSAPRSYFGGELPPTPARTRTVTYDARLLLEARQVLAAAGTSETASDRDIVIALTRYLQSFEPSPEALPARDADWVAIAMGRRGVCRHRAWVFVAALTAVGIPANYVYNEAHAFVEVLLAGQWRRIELGGAATDVDLVGDPDTSLHEPPTDPLAPPAGGPELDGEFGPAQGSEGDNGQGGGPSATGDRANNGAPSGADGAAGADGEPGADGTPGADGEPGADGTPGTDGGPGEIAMDGTTITAGVDEAGEPAPEVSADGRVLPALMLTDAPASTLRNRPFPVAGQLTAPDGTPVADRPVQVRCITPDGRTEVLGEAQTDATGAFTLEVRIPRTVSPGDARLEASFGGDDTWGPTVSP
jgi:hypothetical protein